MQVLNPPDIEKEKAATLQNLLAEKEEHRSPATRVIPIANRNGTAPAIQKYPAIPIPKDPHAPTVTGIPTGREDIHPTAGSFFPKTGLKEIPKENPVLPIPAVPEGVNQEKADLQEDMPNANTVAVSPDTIPAKKPDIPVATIPVAQKVKAVDGKDLTHLPADPNPERNPVTIQEKEVPKEALKEVLEEVLKEVLKEALKEVSGKNRSGKNLSGKNHLGKREPAPAHPGREKSRATIKVIIAGFCCRMENGNHLKLVRKEEKPRSAMPRRITTIPKNRFASTSTWPIVAFAHAGKPIS